MPPIKPFSAFMLIATAISGLALCSPATAYDREAAAKYAILWTDAAWVLKQYPQYYNKGNPYNGNDYSFSANDEDCTNFTSQCLIAGGMRFRGDPGNPSDNTANYGKYDSPRYEESDILLGVHVNPIVNPDMIHFSRTVGNVGDGWRSFTSVYHYSSYPVQVFGPYITGGMTATDPVWKHIKKGDVLFDDSGNTGSPAHAGHMMFVSDVVSVNGAPDLRACGHTTNRNNVYFINGATMNPDHNDQQNFLGAGPWYVLCLKDAPLVTSVSLTSGGNPVKLAWYKIGKQPPKSAWATSKDLVISITFDCPMDTTQTPKVIAFDFSIIQRSFKFSNGSWSADQRTWTGTITAQTLKASGAVNGYAAIQISAAGQDGSYNAVNNELSSYYPADSEKPFPIFFWMDSQGPSVKN